MIIKSMLPYNAMFNWDILKEKKGAQQKYFNFKIL